MSKGTHDVGLANETDEASRFVTKVDVQLAPPSVNRQIELQTRLWLGLLKSLVKFTVTFNTV